MSTFQVLDGAAVLKYFYTLGSGTSGDPYRSVVKRYSNALAEDGKLFTYSPVFSMANNATVNYLLKTPAALKTTLYELTVTTDNSPVFHYLYEDTIVSANGTLATALINNNRQSATAATSLIYSAPTVSSTGTLLFSDFTTGGKAYGGQDAGEFRLIFKPSANYLIQLVNSSTAAANVGLFIKFTET